MWGSVCTAQQEALFLSLYVQTLVRPAMLRRYVHSQWLYVVTAHVVTTQAPMTGGVAA